MTPVRRALVVLVALALLGTAFVGFSRTAAAAQNAPSWSTGNQWTYTGTTLGIAQTVVTRVAGQSSLTIAGTTYSVWDLNTSTTISGGSTVLTSYSDAWFTSDGSSLAKRQGGSLFGSSTSTYAPPQPQYVFPLAPSGSWSGTTNVTTTDNSGTHTASQSYSGTVTAEQTITVGAGTFTTEVVRSPASGSTYTLVYYSEQVGNAVKTEGYLLGTLVAFQNLTAYSYSPALLGLPTTVWILILVVIAVVVVAAAVMVLRRRPRMPMGMPPGPPMQPPQAPPPQP